MRLQPQLKPWLKLCQKILKCAAAAAKSLQSCPALWDSIDGSPPGSPVPGILQARTLEWVAIFFSNAGKWKVKVKSLSGVWLLATPWIATHPAPLSMGLKCEPSVKSGPDSWLRETEVTNVCFFKLLGFRVMCYAKTCLRVAKNPRQFLFFFWFLNQNEDREIHCWNSYTKTHVVLVMVTWLLISKINN